MNSGTMEPAAKRDEPFSAVERKSRRVSMLVSLGGVQCFGVAGPSSGVTPLGGCHPREVEPEVVCSLFPPRPLPGERGGRHPNPPPWKGPRGENGGHASWYSGIDSSAC